jgi:hypothetical protein
LSLQTSWYCCVAFIISYRFEAWELSLSCEVEVRREGKMCTNIERFAFFEADVVKEVVFFTSNSWW